MGQQSVIPLSTALPQLNDSGKEMVADILGLVGHKTAAPFLVDVLLTSKSPNVKQACERALTRMGNPGAGSDPAEMYHALGESYYAEKPELTSFPGEPHQLLWTYNPAIGLNMTAIRTEVYHEAMAMQMSERSLALRGPGNDGAVALWLAANFSREIQTPAEYDNPAYPKGRRDAMFYAVTAGSGPSQSVLARALDAKYTPLARRAIAALEQTAGSSALRGDMLGESARRPLVEALRYPNRRVQYEAALSLGKSQPNQGFGGSERVVPLLASAIRDAAKRYAVIVSANKEIGDTNRRTLERAGYTVLPVGAKLAEVAEPISQVPGVDLIIAIGTPDQGEALIAEAQGNPKLGATPILVLTEVPANIDMARRHERDPMIAVRARGLTEAQVTEAATQLVEAASGGPITAEEARDYASRSLAVLRDLAVSGSTTLDVSEAALPLIGALGETSGKARLDVAEVLARIDQKRVQVALMDAAMNAQGEDRVALINKVSESARRYGNLLETRQVQRVIELASTAPDKEATAAAALIGSLNLSNTNLVPLILNKKG
jgi:HEAT repeat protein